VRWSDRQNGKGKEPEAFHLSLPRPAVIGVSPRLDADRLSDIPRGDRKGKAGVGDPADARPVSATDAVAWDAAVDLRHDVSKTNVAAAERFIPTRRFKRRCTYDDSLARWRTDPRLPEDPGENQVAPVAAEASCRAALFVAYMRPVCARLAPCRAGASTCTTHTVFSPGSQPRVGFRRSSCRFGPSRS
jgi:hypothetical protein